MRYGSKITFLFLAYVLCFSALSAQNRDTLKVYFDTDVFERYEAGMLDAFLQERSGDGTTIEQVTIIGHADVRGSDAYNQNLAEQRAKQVAEYIAEQLSSNKETIIRSLGEEEGENTINAERLAEQRRVDVVVLWFDPMPALEPIVEEPMIKEPEEDVITIDTVAKQNVVLEGLSFIPGRHYPTAESMPILFKLVNTMKKYKNLEIEIQGHICCSYDAEDGMDNDTGEPFLSRNRAEFVYDFLVENGIDEDRMSYVGLGSTQPKVFPEGSDADRQANRRVEIKVK